MWGTRLRGPSDAGKMPFEAHGKPFELLRGSQDTGVTKRGDAPRSAERHRYDAALKPVPLGKKSKRDSSRKDQRSE